MDPIVVLTQSSLRVEPGGRVAVVARIQNPGSIVEGYTVEVVGEPADFALVLPAEVSIFPGEEATVEVVFDPPVSARTPSGNLPFGVRVRSRVDPSNSAVAEGDLDVGSFRNITLDLAPKSSRGRRSGMHRIAMSNWGNADVTLAFTAADPDERLRFELKPEVVALPVGGNATARIRLRAEDTFFRGPPVRHQFTVTAHDADEMADRPDGWHSDLSGAFEQRAILPGWTLAAVGLLVVVAAGLFWWRSRADDVKSEAAAGNEEALQQPASFTLTPTGPDAITVTWQAIRGTQTYNVHWVEPATRDDPNPTVFETTEVPGTQNSVHIDEGLDPGTTYCFQLAAVNAAGESPRTPPQCTDTLEASGAPAPGDLALEYVNDDQTRAELTWTDATGGEAEHVVLRDGVPVDQPIPAGVTRVVLDLKSGRNCFQVFSRQGDEASELSPETCIDGPSGTGTVTTGPGGGEEDLGWIAVVFATQVGDAGATQAAEAKRDELIAQGFDAEILNTIDYPDIPDPDGEPSLFVYVGGFDSREEANAFCDDNFETDCLYFEPGEKAAG